ncbi:MAG TPA: PilN domain-containing protein [Candidatus Bathyarchaeia archaeon]|nr:PilN domain-containing protein [Candidatus Bathyarchaeia archaeon]
MNLLQITRHHLRLIQGQWPEISGCFQVERDPVKTLRQDLERLIKESRLKITEAVVVLPRPDVFCQGLVLPSQEEEELERMIAVQIPMLVPFDASQTMVDYRIVPQSGSGQSEIFLGIASQDRVSAYVADAAAQGISVRDVVLTGDGLDRFIKHFLPDRLSSAKAAAFLFPDAQMSEMVVYDGPVMKAMYYLPYGLQDVPDRLDGFCQEIAFCLKSFAKDPWGNAVGAVAVCGVREGESLTTALTRHGMEAESLNFSDVFAKTNLATVGSASAWACLLGFCAAGAEKPLWSFLPAGAHSQKEEKARRKEGLRFAVSLLLAVVLAVGLYGVRRIQQQRRLRAMEQQIAALQPEIDKADQRQQFFSLVLQNKGALPVVEAVREFYQLLPEDVFLASFVMRGGTVFELQGSALQGDAVSDLQQALVSSASFQNVALEYATKRRRFKEEYTEFKISFELAKKGK